MTPSRLSELKELAAAATPGPWEPILNEGGEEYWLPHPFWTTTACGPCGEANARFIAAARTAVPELVAEVERLTGLLSEAIDEVESWAGYAPEWAKEKWSFNEILNDLRARAALGGQP